MTRFAPLALAGGLSAGCAQLLDLDEYEPPPAPESTRPAPAETRRVDPGEPSSTGSGGSPGAPEGNAPTAVGAEPGTLASSAPFRSYVRNKTVPAAASYSVPAAAGLLNHLPERERVAARFAPGSIGTAAGGTVEVLPEGAFTYAPVSASFFGDDRFEYTLISGGLETVGRARFTLHPPSPIRLQDFGESAGTGFRILSGDAPVRSVAMAGDVNGDGLGDMIVGVPDADAGAGRAYVIFGKTDTRDVRLGELDAGEGGGFALTGAPPGARAGLVVAGGGDFDGDGFDDVLIGAPDYDASPIGDEGAVFVVFGTPDVASVELALWRAGSRPLERFGAALAVLGDFDGDGLTDIAVGSPGANEGTGLATLFLGGTFAEYPLQGDIPGGAAGAALSAAGDVDGDGRADLLIAAPLARAMEADAGDTGGIAYDVLGGNFPPPGVLADQHYFYGVGADGRYGSALTGSGDMDGDGYDELVLLSPGASNGDIWQQGADGLYSLSFWFEYERVSPDPFGVSFAHLNGDARSDLVITAERSVYVLPGSAPSAYWCLAAPDELAGSCGTAFGSLAVHSDLPLAASAVSGEDINGDGMDDLVASTGDVTYVVFPWDTATDVHFSGIDPVSRLGARDGELRGGRGDDRLIYDGTQVRIDGGRGRDTLAVATAELDLLDRSLLASGIEIIDLRGNGAQRLIIDDASVRRMPEDTRNAPSGLIRTLTVSGDAEDVVVVTGDRAYYTAGALPDGSLLSRPPLGAYGLIVSAELQLLLP